MTTELTLYAIFATIVFICLLLFGWLMMPSQRSRANFGFGMLLIFVLQVTFISAIVVFFLARQHVI